LKSVIVIHDRIANGSFKQRTGFSEEGKQKQRDAST